MQLEMLIDFTHDDGKPISIVVGQVYTARPKPGGEGCYIISVGGATVPVREPLDVVRRAINNALVSRKETKDE